MRGWAAAASRPAREGAGGGREFVSARPSGLAEQRGDSPSPPGAAGSKRPSFRAARGALGWVNTARVRSAPILGPTWLLCALTDKQGRQPQPAGRSRRSHSSAAWGADSCRLPDGWGGASTAMEALDGVFGSGSRGPRGVLPRAMLSGTHGAPWVGPQSPSGLGLGGGTRREKRLSAPNREPTQPQSRECGRPGIVPCAALPGTSFCPSVCSPANPPPPFPQHTFSSCRSSECSKDGPRGRQAARMQGQRHRGTADGLACAPSSQRPP